MLSAHPRLSMTADVRFKIMKRIGIVLCCLLAVGLACGVAVGARNLWRCKRAQAEGFEDMRSVQVDGTDGGHYTVDLYWENIKSIPGQHKIMARIWNSESDYNQQEWMSGNRAWLRSVTVRKRKGPDLLVLSFKPMPGRWSQRVHFTNTVVRTGIVGHPQLVAEVERRLQAEMETEQTPSGDRLKAPPEE